MQKGLESADLIADRFAATGRVECTARIAAHERKTLFRKMLLAPHGIARHRTVSHGFAWSLSPLSERAQIVVSLAHRLPRSFFALGLEQRELSSSLDKPASLPPLRSAVIGRQVSGHSTRHSRACRKRLTTLRHGAGAGSPPVRVRVMPEKEDAKALDFEAFFRSLCTLPRFLQPPETLLPSADTSQVHKAGTVDMRMPEKALTNLL